MASSDTKVVARGLLPPIVVTPTDVIDLRREVEALDEFMHQTSLRRGGQAMSIPKLSHSLEEVVKLNNLNLLNTTDRQQLLTFLKELKDSAPVVHISFAADPSSAFMAKIIGWFRENAHPQALIQIGLQPSIAAGCMVRTENKVFDFSLRKRFEEKRQILMDKLNESFKS